MPIFILKNVVFSTLFFVLSLITGFGISSVFKFYLKRSYYGVFCAFVTGFFFLTVLSAIFFTKGVTILAGILIIALYFFYDHYRDKVLPEKNDLLTLRDLLRPVCELTLVITVLIVYRAWYITPSNGYFIEPAYNDYVFYAKLSKYLLETGNENNLLDYVFFSAKPSPYHYIDIWPNSLLHWVTGENAVELIIFTCYTIGAAGVWLGLVSLIERFRTPGIWYKLLALLLIFHCGIYLGDIIHIPLIETTNVFTTNVINYAKLFPIIFIMIFLFHHYAENRMHLVISSLLMLPIINISTAPGCFLLIGIILLISQFRDKQFVISTVLKAVIVAGFIGVFYVVGSKSQSDVASFSVGNFTKPDYIRVFINVIGGAALQQVIIYSPLLILLVISWKNVRNIAWKDVFMVGACFCSFILPWAILHDNPNSIQLFSNFFVPFMSCASLFILLSLHKANIPDYHRWLLICLLIVMPATGLIRDARIRAELSAATATKPDAKVVAFLNEVENPVGVFFSNNYNWAAKATVFGSLDLPFQQFVSRSGFHTISLSVFEIPIDSGRYMIYEKKLIESSPFWQYVNKQKISNDHDVVSFQLQFIRDYNIDYAITNFNNRLPDAIQAITHPVYENEAMNTRVFSINRVN
jgi:hypothetical protein